MNISSTKYVTEDKKIIKATIDGVVIFVPKDEGNRHYQAIQEWVAEGNTIEDAD
jgi:reverse gyrase